MKHVGREQRKLEVIEIWESRYPNISVSEVSELTGLGERVIYDYLKESGQPLPPRRFRQVDVDLLRRVHELYSECGSKAEVGRILDMSRARVGYYLKKGL